ncbi:MAG: protease complex subunit PrcB family protein [Gemmatimonadota bacterium]
MRLHLPASVLTVAFAATVAACSSTGNGNTDVNTPSDPQAQVLAVTPVGSPGQPLTASSGLTAAQRTVIRDEVAWRAAWVSIWQNLSPQPELPAVDFAQEMIVVAALGERGSGGFSIVIDSASRTPTGATVVVHVTSPGANCMNTMAITAPVDVARVPRVTGTVTFRERTSVSDCR